MDIEDVKLAMRCQSMTNEEALQEIHRCEHFADVKLAAGEITQDQAWDVYFGLMHECDERGLMEDRHRLRAKIDVSLYNPMKSSNPGIHFIAMLRARMHGLIKHELN